MGGSSKSVTVGYKYYVGMHMVLCHGQIDSLHKISVDDREAWAGAVNQGQLEIDSPDLFGGESREGGISGKVDVLNGSPTQGINDYLQSKIGGLVSAFRGVASVVLRQNYVGLNPYLKKWSFLVKRIHKRRNGETQWYDEKAEISLNNLVSYDDTFRYKLETSTYNPPHPSNAIGVPAEYTQPDFDDSAWSTGRSAFGDSFSIPGGVAIYEPLPTFRTYVPPTSYGMAIWLRKKFFLPVNPATLGTVEVIAWKNDGGWLWINGARVDHEIPVPPFNYFNVRFVIPNGLLKYGENTIVFQDIEMVVSPDGTLGGSEGGTIAAIRLQIAESTHGDMNPAHIIRECLTDLDWGMGYQDADIDDASFMAAADTLYNEKMGISILWDTQTTIEEFINLIVKHIDAVLYVDRTTGKFVLKLIRNDYEESSLITLNESNIEKITDFARPSFGELTNSVSVTYWDAMTGKDSTVTVQDIALAQMQQCTINVSVNYPGFVSSDIATRVAQRDLKSLSTPLAHCTIYANTDAASLNIGSCFKLSWNDYDIAELVMRVTGISYGDGKTNRVRIQCVQDVFSTPESVIIQQPPPSWENPSAQPLPAQVRKVFEIPYLELVQTVGQSDIDSILSANPEIGYVGAAAVRPGNAISARMFDDLGSGYTEIGNLDFSPGATLDGDIGEMATTFAIKDGVDLDQVQLNTWVEIDSEIMAVTAISETLITVKRGCLDTTPKKHLSGAYLVFWDNYAQGDDTELVTSDVAKVKICTVTGSGQLPLSAAPEDSVTISGRAARPYPPGNVKVNGAYFPQTIPGTEQLALTWAHRDRKQQTASLVGFTEGSIGPETGTTYTLRLYGETDNLLRTETGLTGTGYVWSGEEGDSNLAIPGIVGIDAYSTALLGFNPTALYLIEEESGTSMIDTSGNAQHGSYIGGAIPVTPALVTEGSKSIYLTSSKYATAPGAVMNSLSGFSIVLWVQWTHGNNTVILERNGNTGHSIQSGGPSSTIPSGRIVATSTYGNAVPYLVSSISINDGKPHCVVIVFGTTVASSYIFIDGVDRTTRPYSSISPSYGSSTVWHIGSRAGLAGTGFEGRVDGIAFVPSLLTQDNAAAINAAGRFSYYRLNGTVRCELESLRDSITSYQKHNISVDRVGFGYNFGKYFGGI